MARRPRVSEADREVWARYLQLVDALPGRETLPMPPLSETPPPRAPAPRELPPVRLPQRLGFLVVGEQPSGLDSANWLRFKTGKLVAARKLDLHHSTIEQAFYRLRGFMAQAHADRVRVVEVVTGRGSGPEGGVLRRELPIWLNLPEIRPLILAAAHPHVQNPGSVRLLLRKPK